MIRTEALEAITPVDARVTDAGGDDASGWAGGSDTRRSSRETGRLANERYAKAARSFQDALELADSSGLPTHTLMDWAVVASTLPGFSRNPSEEAIETPKPCSHELGIRNTLVENLVAPPKRRTAGRLWIA